jgi:NAD(P)-dependent dehydrogenase (short-subunit alcohol dehydrogenase family)
MVLQNRSAIVTGGGSGLGRAGALALARAGASVLVSDLNEASARETVDAIAQQAAERGRMRPTRQGGRCRAHGARRRRCVRRTTSCTTTQG